MFNTIIKNGLIFDGLGNKPIQADLAIKGDTIEKIEPSIKDKADLTIDADGYYIMPGFIDMTTHADIRWDIFQNPEQANFIKQGVTTIIGGHGGYSPAPIVKKEAFESLSKSVDINKININWQTTKEYLSAVSDLKLSVNYGMLTGHETLRSNILDHKKKKPEEKDTEQINQLLKNSLEEGSFGLSMSFSLPFLDDAVCEEEITTLFKTVSVYNAFSSHHFEDEGQNLLPSVSRLISFLRKTDSRGHISHFKALGRKAWNDFEDALEMIKFARQENINLTCDFFPYLKTGSSLASFLPSWVTSGGEEKILELLKQKENHQNIIDHLKKLTLHYDKITVASADSKGKTISEISADSGITEEEVIISLLLINNLRISILNESISEKNVESLSIQDFSAIASDGNGSLPHPRSFGTFPKIFSEIVKEKELLKWEEAVYKMTGLPAKILNLTDRGVLRPKNRADITIIDPNTIKDVSTYEEPNKSPKGILYVFVNGILTLAEGQIKERRGGEVLKRK